MGSKKHQLLLRPQDRRHLSLSGIAARKRKSRGFLRLLVPFCGYAFRSPSCGLLSMTPNWVTSLGARRFVVVGGTTGRTRCNSPRSSSSQCTVSPGSNRLPPPAPAESSHKTGLLSLGTAGLNSDRIGGAHTFLCVSFTGQRWIILHLIPVSNLIPFTQPLPPRLPTIEGNVDYREFQHQLQRIDFLLRASHVETQFITLSVARWLAQKSTPDSVINPKQQVRFQAHSRCALRCNILRTLLQLGYRKLAVRLADSPLLQRFCGLSRMDK